MSQSAQVTAVEQQLFDHVVLSKLASLGHVAATAAQEVTMLRVVDELFKHHVANEHHQKIAAQTASMTVLEKMASNLGVAPDSDGRGQRLAYEAQQFIQTYPGIVDALADRGT